MISEIAGVKRKLGECQRSREGSAKEVRCSRVAALSFQGVDIGYDSGGGLGWILRRLILLYRWDVLRSDSTGGAEIGGEMKLASLGLRIWKPYLISVRLLC